MTTPITGAELLQRVGLMPDGPAVVGRPIRAGGGGVYIVELASPLPRAPIDLAIVGKWIEGVPSLRLDGERPTSKALGARLGAFWLPSSHVLYVGSSDTSMGGRIGALERHVLGDRRPHAASQWLKTLRIDGLRVWWAATEAPEEYEDAVLTAFAQIIPAEEQAALFDATVVLPFANLRTPAGERKRTGITGAVPPEAPIAVPPPTRVVDVAAGSADGVAEPKGSGTVRRTNASPPPKPPAGRPAARRPAAAHPLTSGRVTPRATPASQRPAVEALQLTPDGHARLVAEHLELTQGRRGVVIDRIKRARELGDLKENADYTAAREEQSFLEGRIQAIEAQLRHGVVVQATGGHRVELGSHVTIEFEGETLEYTVVGPAESDPSSGRISSSSPVGRALIGRAAGDEAVVTTPRGEVRYRVISIA